MEFGFAVDGAIGPAEKTRFLNVLVAGISCDKQSGRIPNMLCSTMGSWDILHGGNSSNKHQF